MKTNSSKKLACLVGAVLATAVLVSTARADYISTLNGLGPVGWWRFNDSTATAPLFIVTNAGSLGSVANGYVVQTVSDTPLLGQPGLIGNCVRFINPGESDAGNCDSKIDVPWQAGLNQNPPFSIEFWAKPNSLGSDSTGFCPLEDFNPTGNEGGSRRGWLFYINNAGTWNFRLGAYSGYTLSLLGSGGNAVVGTWEHIVVTWDGTNVVMYANGAVIGNATSVFPADGWVPNAVSFLRMGGTPLTGDNAAYNAISGTTTIGNRGYDGWLQHVAIYNKVLTAAQVNAHYSAASTNNAGYTAQIKADGPVGYWPLNDAPVATPANTTVADSGINGTATGTVHPGVKVQPGPGYAGFGTDTNGLFIDGVNGYIQVNDTANLNSGPIQNQITLTAWVKPMAQDYFRDIIARGFDENEAETFLRISRGPFFSGDFENYAADFSGDDTEYYEMGTSDGENFYDSAQFPIPAGDIGNWVFLAGTCDGSNWNLYRNGQLVATVPFDGDGADTGPVLPAQQWTIGSRAPDDVTAGTLSADFPGQTESSDGTIFEPAIFNTALTGSQIQSLYAAALVPPVITLPPQQPGSVGASGLVVPGIVYSGNSVTFTSYAEGAPTIGYEWTSNGVPTGVTTTNYTISSIPAGSYTIAIVATNAYGTNSAQTTFTVVNEAASITTQPLPQKRFIGANPFTLDVGAIGSLPMSFTWYLGNTVVQSGPSSSYTAAAALTNEGTYTVVISNAGGSVTSSPPVAVSMVPVPSGYPSVIFSDSPLSYWRLDETSGTTAYDVMSGNNGVYNNATLGLPGYSPLDSDTAAGFSGLNSYVGSISGTAINFTNNAPFTLEAWVNGPAGLPDQSTIIAKGIGNNGTTETEQFALDVSGGNFRFFTTHSGNQYQALATVGPDGTWQYVVGVYDSSSLPATLRLYVNGEQVATVTAPYAQSTTVSPVSIGSKRTGNDPNYDGTFNGTIDEVAVYNKALDASTILAHYDGAYGTNLAPVITIQPQSATNYIGLPVTLYVGAYGSAPLTYQWYHGTPPNVSNPVGSDSSTLAISSVASADAGNYYCNISNPVWPGGTNTAVVSIAALTAPTSPPNIPGLVAHLPFNGNLNDVTGRGNNGTGMHAANPTGYPVNPSGSPATISTLTPGPATSPNFYYSDGPFPGSQALHYSTVATNSGGLTANGTSVGLDDYYVTLGVRPDLQFGTNSFSVSFWIRLPEGFGETAPDGGDLPFFTDVTNSTGGFGYCFTMAYGYGTADPVPTTAPQYNQVGTWGTSIYDAAGNGIRYYGDNYQSINDGNYHNLVQIIDRGTGKFTAYIDGVPAIQYLDAGTSLNSIGSIDNGAPACIGQDPTGLYGEDGEADIADLGVWRRALSPLEVGSIYEAGTNSFTGTPPNPNSIIITGASKSGGSVNLSWSALPPITYTYSVLSRTNLVFGSWTTNVTGISSTNYTDSTASNSTKFYRVTSP
ncbi:MAG TPA: LamG-like jellyroll fold domain-containing protein [Alphaproteobacteria bacterium]|nr:LamG-like jellyroll fold domain-containing protein [Alphaproteobacteria bacterium]